MHASLNGRNAIAFYCLIVSRLNNGSLSLFSYIDVYIVMSFYLYAFELILLNHANRRNRTN